MSDALEPFYDLTDVSRKLGNCSRSTLYRLIEQGKLVRVNIGSKALITGQSLGGYVEELMATPDLSPDLVRHTRKRRDTA
jgi:excisionase family DNA binding protein